MSRKDNETGGMTKAQRRIAETIALGGFRWWLLGCYDSEHRKTLGRELDNLLENAVTSYESAYTAMVKAGYIDE